MDWNGRRVLVTGHTGFKGAWLCRWLARRGAEVHGYALPPDTEPSLHRALRDQAGLASSTLADIRDASCVAAAFTRARPEVVFHLAAQPLVLRSYADPKETFDVNVGGTVNVLEATRRVSGVRALVNITSDKCYENREWPWGYREEDALGGHDPYSASKGAAELVFSSYQRSFLAAAGIAAASARAGNVIGGGDWAPDRIVPDTVRALSAGVPVSVRRPTAIRPWQHVLEPLGGYLTLAEALWRDGKRFQGAWNFGPDPGNERPVAAVIDALVRYWGSGSWQDRSDPNAPHEASVLRLSIDKARSLLGWAPRWTFERTVGETVAWYRAFASGAPAEQLCDEQIDAYELSRPSAPGGTS